MKRLISANKDIEKFVQECKDGESLETAARFNRGRFVKAKRTKKA